MRNPGAAISAPRGAKSGLTTGARAAIARTAVSRAQLDALISGVTLDGDPAELGAKRKRTRAKP